MKFGCEDLPKGTIWTRHIQSSEPTKADSSTVYFNSKSILKENNSNTKENLSKCGFVFVLFKAKGASRVITETSPVLQ